MALTAEGQTAEGNEKEGQHVEAVEGAGQNDTCTMNDKMVQVDLDCLVPSDQAADVFLSCYYVGVSLYHKYWSDHSTQQKPNHKALLLPAITMLGDNKPGVSTAVLSAVSAAAGVMPGQLCTASATLLSDPATLMFCP